MDKTDDSNGLDTNEVTHQDETSVQVRVPKKRNKEASKLKLLQAAVEVFAREGYDAATTKEVARTAGVNEALIQKYFDGKAGLLLAVLNSFSGKEADNKCGNCPTSPNLADDIQAYFDKNFEHCMSIGKMMRVAVSRAIVDERIADFLKEKTLQQKVIPLTARLKRFQDEGKIAAGADLEASAYAIISMAFYFGFMAPTVYKMAAEKAQALSKEMAKTFALGLAPK